MIIIHGQILPNHSQWAKAMWVIDLSNQTERQLIPICCSGKHQSNSTFVFHLFHSIYFLLLFLRCINAIWKFSIEQAQLIASLNSRWRYFILPDFIPEPQLPIVDDFLLLFVTLLYGIPMSLHTNNTNSLQNIKNLPI